MTGLELAGTVVSVAGAFIFHTQVFQLFTASEYHSVSYLLPGIEFAGGLFAAGQMLSLNLLGQLKKQSMLPVKIGNALIGVAVNTFRAYRFSVPGVVGA